jgi:hypothetical protein
MSLRNDIVDNIADRYISYPAQNGNFNSYRYVTREPMCDGMIKNLRPGESAISIFEGTETKGSSTMTTTNAELPITIEVYYKTTSSDRDMKTRKISSKLNKILAEVVKIMLSDRQCGNNSLNIYELSNTLDVDGIYDDTVGLEATFSVQYRHLITDPTTRV